jgi:hypothetical protein
MKRLMFFVLASLSTLSLRAQLFSPQSVTGAALGGLAGGIIGHNAGHHTGEGFLIGAGAGLLIGALVNARSCGRGEYSYSNYPSVSYARSYSADAHPYAPTVVNAAPSSRTEPTPALPSMESPSILSVAGRSAAPTQQNAMAGANRLFGR